MTSLSTAKTSTVETSLVATTTDTGEELDEMAETSASEMEAKQKIAKEGKYININNPITDIVKETNAMTVKLTPTTETVSESAVTKHMPATATATPQFASASKIPHLQQQQAPLYTHGRELKQLLHSPDPFRRSVSLRMRGSKSKLFNNYDSQYLEMERNTRHLSNITVPTPNTTNTRYHHPLAGVLEQRQQQQHHQSLQRDTHERYAISAVSFGGAATRRKAVLLLGSAVSTQTPAATVGNLTCSQSLRRSYLNYNYYSQQKLAKTDAIKEESAGGVTKVGSGAETGVDAAITGIVVADNVAPLKQNTQREIQQPSDGENCADPNGSVQGKDITYKEDGVGEKKRIEKGMQRMSLNLNGSGGERSTTTTKSTATVAAAAAVAGTPTRNGSDANRIPPVTPKTPNNVAVPTRYVKSSPTTAQETKLTPKTPPVTPDSPCTYLDDDLDSMYSFATTTSGRSTMSCEHPYVARNGTTFSGRKMKYVVHCSNYAGQVGPDYLTPTQRAARHIRRLKELLCLARQDLEQKDSEILRLTREVVELRLFKASLSSPEERSASSDAVTVREAELKTSQDVSPIVDMVDDATKSSPRHIPNQHHLHTHSQNLHHTTQLTSEMQSSFADSGHFEDLSVHSKDSYAAHTQDIACGSDEAIDPAEAGGHEACTAGGDEEDYTATIKNYELQRQELIRMYEQKIEELIRTQDGASSEMKRSHNDKVEALLQKLAECNTRYADIVPDYEHAKERIRELEKQLEDLQRKLAEHEEKQNKMYLHMYQKGQEAERIARADQALELAHRAPDNKVSINELLHQLQNTQDELENIRAAGCRKESGSNHALLTAKEAISLWVLGARKTIYRRLLEAQKNRTHVDPEVTLQFLKSAIYYFLTDKENSQGHLQAIESILEFTEAEKQNINKARMTK